MPTLRRVYRQGNSQVISIPSFALDHCGLAVGGYFELHLQFGPAILLTPHYAPPGGNGTQAKLDAEEKQEKDNSPRPGDHLDDSDIVTFKPKPN